MTYVTNSPVVGMEARKALGGFGENAPTYMIPRWIYDAVIGKFNLMEIREYRNLRQVLSLTDLAHLELIRTKLLDKVLPDTGRSFEFSLCSFIPSVGNYGASIPGGQMTNTMTSAHQAEIVNTVNPLMNSTNALEEVMARLKAPEEYGSPSNDTAITPDLPFFETKEKTSSVPYSVVNTDGSLYIIVEEGFVTHLEGKDEKLAFLSHVLKSAYVVSAISAVNRSVWYRQYLLALASK